jgi:hypothetical protein
MKKFYFWIIATLITVAAAMYQRITGPTYPEKTSVTVDGATYDLKLKRSQTNTYPCLIRLVLPENIKGNLYFRRFRSVEEWTVAEMYREGGFLAGELPSQPAAGKLEYFIVLAGPGGNEVPINRERPVVIRFKGNVPAAVMIPHIIIMFLAMLLSNVAGLTAAFGRAEQRKYGRWALWLMLAGGMILGPVVQKYAFGELWTGIPFGWDLTDNKTLIAVAGWIIAVVLNHRKDRPAYTVAAAILLLLVYSIPHSLFGSELDFSTGTITTG